MAEIDILEQETVIDAEGEAEQDRMAADDLQRIEEEIKQEAEASVEDFDDEGDERRAVEAAEAAFDFDQAEELTGKIADEVDERS